MKFSVLMSIYEKEKPQYFVEALESVLNQTVIPNEIVIIEDGKLTKDLQDIIFMYKENIQIVLRTIHLKKIKD